MLAVAAVVPVVVVFIAGEHQLRGIHGGFGFLVYIADVIPPPVVRTLVVAGVG